MFTLGVVLLIVAVLSFGVDSDSTDNESRVTPTPTVLSLSEAEEVTILASGLLGIYFTYTKSSL